MPALQLAPAPTGGPRKRLARAVTRGLAVAGSSPTSPSALLAVGATARARGPPRSATSPSATTAKERAAPRGNPPARLGLTAPRQTPRPTLQRRPRAAAQAAPSSAKGLMLAWQELFLCSDDSDAYEAIAAKAAEEDAARRAAIPPLRRSDNSTPAVRTSRGARQSSSQPQRAPTRNWTPRKQTSPQCTPSSQPPPPNAAWQQPWSPFLAHATTPTSRLARSGPHASAHP